MTSISLLPLAIATPTAGAPDAPPGVSGDAAPAFALPLFAVVAPADRQSPSAPGIALPELAVVRRGEDRRIVLPRGDGFGVEEPALPQVAPHGEGRAPVGVTVELKPRAHQRTQLQLGPGVRRGPATAAAGAAPGSIGAERPTPAVTIAEGSPEQSATGALIDVTGSLPPPPSDPLVRRNGPPEDKAAPDQAEPLQAPSLRERQANRAPRDLALGRNADFPRAMVSVKRTGPAPTPIPGETAPHDFRSIRGSDRPGTPGGEGRATLIAPPSNGDRPDPFPARNPTGMAPMRVPASEPSQDAVRPDTPGSPMPLGPDREGAQRHPPPIPFADAIDAGALPLNAAAASIDPAVAAATSLSKRGSPVPAPTRFSPINRPVSRVAGADCVETPAAITRETSPGRSVTPVISIGTVAGPPRVAPAAPVAMPIRFALARLTLQASDRPDIIARATASPPATAMPAPIDPAPVRAAPLRAVTAATEPPVTPGIAAPAAPSSQPATIAAPELARQASGAPVPTPSAETATGTIPIAKPGTAPAMAAPARPNATGPRPNRETVAPASPAVVPIDAPRPTVAPATLRAASPVAAPRPAARVAPFAPSPLDTPAPQPIVPAAPIPTGADLQRAPLDLTRADWPATMIDRIERLRDDANAADTSIRLIPDALGAIEVSLHQDGEATHVHFTADQPQTRTILAEAQPRLAELAEARGLKLGQTGVGGGEAGTNTGAGQQQRQQPQSFVPRAPLRDPRQTTNDHRIA